MSRKSI